MRRRSNLRREDSIFLALQHSVVCGADSLEPRIADAGRKRVNPYSRDVDRVASLLLNVLLAFHDEGRGGFAGSCHRNWSESGENWSESEPFALRHAEQDFNAPFFANAGLTVGSVRNAAEERVIVALGFLLRSRSKTYGLQFVSISESGLFRSGILTERKVSVGKEEGN
jgi:hypothetical protein